MDKAEITIRIAELEAQIAELPRGSVVYKSIKGKKWPYLQWTEGGKSKSQFVKEEELALVTEQVAQRKAMQAELKSLKAKAPKQTQVTLPAFKTNVITGSGLMAMTDGIKGWKKRDCFATLQKYLKSKATDRVCLVYGLRRTGKTTMLRQAVLEMTATQAAHTAYIKARGTDTMADINQDLTALAALGYKYILLDEVTLMRDFIDSAALFSDVYAAQGMKIVLSGTDSLGFWFALDQELYDRAITIHTTYIRSVSIADCLASTVSTSISATAVRSVPESLASMMRTSTPRMLPSAMTSPHEDISTLPSVRTSNTLCPAARQEGISGICNLCTKPES